MIVISIRCSVLILLSLISSCQNLANEMQGDVVKEEQVICYIDQFGTTLPVKVSVWSHYSFAGGPPPRGGGATCSVLAILNLTLMTNLNRQM